MGFDITQLEALLDIESKSCYQRQDYLFEMHLQSYLCVNDTVDVFIADTNDDPSPTTSYDCEPQSPRSVTDSSATISPNFANELWRERMCLWMFQIADFYDLDRDLVAFAMSYLDRYLAKNKVGDTETFLLVAVASIYIALKLHGRKNIPMRCISTMSRGIVKEDNLALLELSMLHSLEWKLYPVTPCSFIMQLHPLVSSVLNGEAETLIADDVINFARFVTELSLCKYEFIRFQPSLIGFAAILRGMSQFDVPRETVLRFRALVFNVFGRKKPEEVDLDECSCLLLQLHSS